MIKHEILETVSQMALRSGNSPSTINKAADQLGIIFPSDYREFLMYSDGAAGNIGTCYLDIWSLADVLQSNADIQVDVYPPGLVGIAGDGGNELFAFDTRRKDYSIVQVPMIGLNLDDAWHCSDTFNDWLIKLAQS